MSCLRWSEFEHWIRATHRRILIHIDEDPGEHTFEQLSNAMRFPGLLEDWKQRSDICGPGSEKVHCAEPNQGKGLELHRQRYQWALKLSSTGPL